ncbi:dihydrolipoamide acetyltransferase family protein [Sulfurimonas paralvinellae]|uniref:Dihydrolipoamide acetyltransferase component of pyruvate dehydrogenase complex n=1 Tax=Sulfurimonas paralvinellae TaxID=317658 RepID=A0A7M1B7Z6_9BACT|nr:dihydrolipoamide acetyltransferase family protein [Sulfurimonas paralvinellae]QOP45785.1 2-oxo acid dehydrogenase subunit E2 [Sulfurimonas paralvinellae]
MYEIVMPQLSDSMEEGKLIAWKKHLGEHVNVGDVIAEVESDKAIMEVQSFKAGMLSEVNVKEGDAVPVGSVIARIDTGAKESKAHEPKKVEAKEKPVVKQVKVQETVASVKEEPKEEPHAVVKSGHTAVHLKGGISPKARAKAAALGVDVAKVMTKNANQTVHAEDVDAYAKERYFTPKARKLLQAYHLDSSLFVLDHKIDSDEVQHYIDTNELSLPKALTSMQKAIILNVTASAAKPTFHIYESIDAALLEKHTQHSITAWLVKIFAKVMMQHENFRAKLLENAISIAPNASLSIAVADDNNLYMPVIKDANKLTIDEISKQLAAFKKKLQSSSFSAEDMQGGSFGISNLGMLGVKRFDAMINRDESGIMAIGGIEDGKISITLTADHRLINGYEAALFMNDVKKELREPLNFKD